MVILITLLTKLSPRHVMSLPGLEASMELWWNLKHIRKGDIYGFPRCWCYTFLSGALICLLCSFFLSLDVGQAHFCTYNCSTIKTKSPNNAIGFSGEHSGRFLGLWKLIKFWFAVVGMTIDYQEWTLFGSTHTVVCRAAQENGACTNIVSILTGTTKSRFSRIRNSVIPYPNGTKFTVELASTQGRPDFKF